MIQLTGLSCLDEWTLTPQTTVSEGSSALDDDCPCHFTFVSSPSTYVHRSRVMTKVAARPPTWHVFAADFTLFRPPALA